MYPTVESKFTKHIYIYGTDGHSYLFIFIKLTNGTDVEIGKYKLDDFGKWEPLNIDPCETIKKRN